MERDIAEKARARRKRVGVAKGSSEILLRRRNLEGSKLLLQKVNP